MNRSRFFYCVPLFICISLLFSCRRFDLNFKDPAGKCRIDMMTGDFFDQTVHREFTYNQFGDPIKIEYIETGGGTGTPNTSFEYNSSQQLIAYKGFGEHRLFYNSLGQVIIDSLIQNYTGADFRFEDRFYYDFFGRIMRVVSKFYYNQDNPDMEAISTTSLYEYDKRGNLVIADATYDKKTSIYRTHAIWMFLNRNYSLNNPVVATSYNANGLPLTFTNGISFFESSIDIKSIDYNCTSEAK